MRHRRCSRAARRLRPIHLCRSTFGGQLRNSVAKTTRTEPKPGEPVTELIPPRPTLPSVREVARDCKACDLYKRGTQTVFGEGPRRAEVMMVGEQPGDAEDIA